MAAPPAKGNTEQSEEGDLPQLPVSPKPDDEQSRSQSPTQLQVTGRRLWKNVYDELGGSPGSTSAATCTRRHYERLVLPYVRHLKGEDDKPLPPTKPRKQYKMAKELRGDDGTTEKLKKAKDSEERRVEQTTPGKTKSDATGQTQLPCQGSSRDSTEQLGPVSGPSPPLTGASSCPEAYKRLLSSFYCKGAHGKKLRAVSPFLKEVDSKETGGKPAAPGLAVSCLLGPTPGPTPPEAYRGTMLRCPLNFTGSADPLKGQASLPFSPLVIPAFPAHLLATTGSSPMAASLMHFPPTPYDAVLRNRLGPASSAWHMPPVTTYAAPHFFHLNTKL